MAEFITLKGGLTVPVPAFDLFTELDLKGLSMSCEGGKLLISKAGEVPDLTTEDRECIKTYKAHLLALVAYCQTGH